MWRGVSDANEDLGSRSNPRIGSLGAIPPELNSLSGLRRLAISGNVLTGCIPAGLREVEISDLHDVGLPFC